jgi:hypothetical protein
MVIFGYSYNKDEILQSKVPVTFLDFSEYKKIKKDDFVVVFGLSFTGSDTFSFQTMSEVCYRAENLVYISSSSVYPFSIFKHKESKSLITPRSFDGAVNLSLEEFVLDTGIDLNKNTTVLRVDLLEESGIINIINERSLRGVYGSFLTKLSVISIVDLLKVLNKIESNPEQFSQKIYNVATKSISEFSYYKSIASGRVYPSLAIKNTSFDVSKAKKDGLL